MSTLIAGIDGFGSVFAFSSVGSSGTFTNTVGVLSLDMPSWSRGVVDVTNWGTTDNYEQVIQAGVIKTGSVGITGVLLTSTAASWNPQFFQSLIEAGGRCGWKVVAGPNTASSQSVWYGDGYITEFTPTVPFDDKITYKIAFKITGKVTGPANTT
jgi:predicted secreted protein